MDMHRKLALQSSLLVLLLLISVRASHAATPAEIDTLRAKALAWLFLHQDGDGDWDGPGKTDIQATGNVVLAYERAGISAGYSRAVALTWLANAHPRSVVAMGFQAAEPIKSAPPALAESTRRAVAHAETPGQFRRKCPR